MPRQTILMCAPDYYGVDYVINEWMKDQVGRADHKKAQAQWENLRKTLAEEADIALLPPQKGVPDLVFTANAGLVIGKSVIVSRFREPERQLEEPFNLAWFKEHDFTIIPWPKNAIFEGAGDALLDRGQNVLWNGHGFRTGESATGLLEQVSGRRVVDLRLVDPRFYHLDTCLCPLPGGWLLYYPPAFDAESQAKIEAVMPEDKRIVVTEEDALRFNCNAVDLNGKVFMNDPSDALKKQMHKIGLTAVTVPMTEYLKAGGACKCLTLKLVEP